MGKIKFVPYFEIRFPIGLVQDRESKGAVGNVKITFFESGGEGLEEEKRCDEKLGWGDERRNEEEEER